MSYPNAPTAGLAGAQSQETRMQALSRTIDERAAHLATCIKRIDSFLDRTEPTPEVASNQARDSQPIDQSFNGAHRRLAALGEMLERLSSQCDRLERIA